MGAGQADLSPTDLLRAYEVFLYEAARLREKHADRISLLIGLETDYITPLDLGNTTRLVADHQEIDCLVGSVHHVNGVSIDFDRSTWLRAVRTVNLGLIRTTMVASSSGQPVLAPSDPDDPHLQPGYTPTIPELRSFLLAYFDWQYELLRNHRPEVIGHFDLCLLWTPSVSLRSEDFEGVWEKVERNVRYIVEYGGLFEANVAALRKGWETSYPGRGVLEVSPLSFHSVSIADWRSISSSSTD